MSHAAFIVLKSHWSKTTVKLQPNIRVPFSKGRLTDEAMGPSRSMSVVMRGSRIFLSGGWGVQARRPENSLAVSFFLSPKLFFTVYRGGLMVYGMENYTFPRIQRESNFFFQDVGGGGGGGAPIFSRRSKCIFL